jgi:hypothetical protein
MPVNDNMQHVADLLPLRWRLSMKEGGLEGI